VVGQPEKPDKQGTGNDGRGQRDTGWQETTLLLARLSGIGWYVVGSIGAGIGAGWLLDRQFDTEPVLLLIGLVIGVIGAFTGMIRMLNAFGKQRTKR
jgi:F0F1-type ATP synthase assembly protein I